ncbi:MAG: YceH family protein [Phycisphaerae bacterium]|nr:YceH family protein [Phycisphaerae bacterium]
MTLPTLTPHESRTLGTLVEKAQTTPQQYPLTLNALVNGCNQKNNRDPVTTLTDDDVLAALEGLRSKELAREALLAGSRVHKYRHVARERLAVCTAELIVLTELLLRGPQAPGELRSNAQRMMPPGDASLSTLESTQSVLDGLRSRPEPMVVKLPRRPGERAERYAQLLCPDLHPLDDPAPHSPTVAPRAEPHSNLNERVEQLESEVASLRAALERLGAL